MSRVSNFQERFAELLEKSSKPDISLATDLGVSKQTISAWKTGVRSPKTKMVSRIAEFFDVDVAWLMGYDVPPTRTDDNIVSTEDWDFEDDTMRYIARGMSELTDEQKQKYYQIGKTLFGWDFDEEGNKR